MFIRYILYILILITCKEVCSVSKSIVLNRFNFQFLSGSVPLKLGKIIVNLKNHAEQRSMLNRCILHGPPGNGKTSLVKEIAALCGAKLIEIKHQTIVDKFQGSGPQAITQTLRICQEEAKEQLVIVMLDEVEGIAKINDEHSNNNFDRYLVKQELWKWMDQIKGNKNIYLFMCTNMYKDLDARIVDRCGDNIIEIPNPNLAMRKEIIGFHFKRHKLIFHKEDEKVFINYIAKKKP